MNEITHNQKFKITNNNNNNNTLIIFHILASEKKKRGQILKFHERNTDKARETALLRIPKENKSHQSLHLISSML